MIRYFAILSFLSFSSSFAQSNCLLVNQIALAGDQVVSEQRNIYNELGKIIEEWSLNSVGLGQTYTSKKVYEYNGKGYLSKISEYLNDGFKSSKTLLYDNLGRLVSETQNNDARALNTLTSENGTSQKLYFDENGIVRAKRLPLKIAKESLPTTKLEMAIMK